MDQTVVSMINTVVDSCFSLYGSMTEEEASGLSSNSMLKKKRGSAGTQDPVLPIFKSPPMRYCVPLLQLH
jgi:hypothetical protein